MSNFNEKQLVAKTHEIHEEQITVRFDILKPQGAPQTGALIMHQLGFGVVTIIGMSLDEAQIGDIAMELMHNGFCTKAQVWVKM